MIDRSIDEPFITLKFLGNVIDIYRTYEWVIGTKKKIRVAIVYNKDITLYKYFIILKCVSDSKSNDILYKANIHVALNQGLIIDAKSNYKTTHYTQSKHNMKGTKTIPDYALRYESFTY